MTFVSVCRVCGPRPAGRLAFQARSRHISSVGYLRCFRPGELLWCHRWVIADQPSRAAGGGALSPARWRVAFDSPTRWLAMMATDARFTLAQLKHWDTRLSQELEILQHDIESSEATHRMCEAPNPACVCATYSCPTVKGLSPGTAASAPRRSSRCVPCASRRSCVGVRCEVR